MGTEPTIGIEFPAPRRFTLSGGLFAFGYEGDIVYPLGPRPFSPPAGAKSVRIEADVDYLTCEVDCVPYRYTLALDLPIAPTASAALDPGTAPLLDQAVQSLPRRDGTLPGVAIRAELALPPSAALSVEIEGVTASPEADLFVELQDLFEIGRPVVSPLPNGVRFILPLTPRRSDLPFPATFPLAFTAVGLVHEGVPVAVEARRELKAESAPVPGAAEGSSGSLSLWLPSLLAVLAAALTALAMTLWGKEEATLGRGLLGFAALALGVGCLRLLTERVAPLGVAGIELALLGEGLALWLHRRRAGRRGAGVLAPLAVLAGLVAPWLATQQRLPAARPAVERPDSTVNRGEGR